jgi:hypothetical protein
MYKKSFFILLSVLSLSFIVGCATPPKKNAEKGKVIKKEKVYSKQFEKTLNINSPSEKDKILNYLIPELKKYTDIQE